MFGFGYSHLKIIFVLGGPGSGKGTQSTKLCAEYPIEHISTGDLCREEVEKQSKYGVEIQKCMEDGSFVSCKLMVILLKAKIRQLKYQGKVNFLIDGFPREMDQALRFEYKVVSPKSVIFFDCPEETMIERLLKRGEFSGRVDDNREVIKNRIQGFNQSTMLVIENYKSQDKVIRISALSEDQDQIYQELKLRLNDILDLTTLSDISASELPQAQDQSLETDGNSPVSKVEELFSKDDHADKEAKELQLEEEVAVKIPGDKLDSPISRTDFIVESEEEPKTPDDEVFDSLDQTRIIPIKSEDKEFLSEEELQHLIKMKQPLIKDFKDHEVRCSVQLTDVQIKSFCLEEKEFLEQEELDQPSSSKIHKEIEGPEHVKSLDYNVEQATEIRAEVQRASSLKSVGKKKKSQFKKLKRWLLKKKNIALNP